MTDADLEKLATLSSRADVGTRASKRIRERAQNVLAHERRLAAHPWLARFDRFYSDVVEPLVVIVAAAGYLVWTVQQVFFAHP